MLELFWGKCVDIKEVFSKQPRYPNLSKLALACVVLANSNADSERIFSMLKKIQTEPLKPSMREISPSAMTAEGEILRERHFQPKYMTCTLYTSTKHQ
jgi:hypothetical protein